MERASLLLPQLLVILSATLLALPSTLPPQSFNKAIQDLPMLQARWAGRTPAAQNLLVSARLLTLRRVLP